jgi:hypothetical protein
MTTRDNAQQSGGAPSTPYRCALASRFRDIFRRLLAREQVDFDTRETALMFEVIATTLLGGGSQRSQQYFDGAVGVVSTVKMPRQVEFHGEMWVGEDQKQWTESFQATVTDTCSSKQGIWVVMKMGTDRGEGELMSCFGCDEKDEGSDD